tara:strand:+ start:937 stop:1545 length:609 start_codon:yes stop_codon:yes gene_type:complete
MDNKNPLIPFGWLPGHWGLKGKTRERAEAEYKYTGYKLETALANIDIEDASKLKQKQLEIDYKYGMIEEQDYDYAMLEFVTNPVERELRKLDLDYQYSDMKDIDYDKHKATIRKEPWVSVLDLNVRDDTGNFELDWNDFFVEELKEAGFKGMSDEDIVNSWFTRICRDIALEEYSGTGDFDEQLAEAENKQSADDDGRRVIK